MSRIATLTQPGIGTVGWGAAVNLNFQEIQDAINNLGNASDKNVGTTAGTVCAGDDSRLTNARTPTAHATTHQPGGSDAMAVDAAAGTGSLRTVGTGALQACAGNDSRLTNTRTPSAHATTHQPGGSDAMAVDAAAGTGSLRTLGRGAAQACAGNDYAVGLDGFSIALLFTASGLATNKIYSTTGTSASMSQWYIGATADNNGADLTAFWNRYFDIANPNGYTRFVVKLTKKLDPSQYYFFELIEGGASGAFTIFSVTPLGGTWATITEGDLMDVCIHPLPPHDEADGGFFTGYIYEMGSVVSGVATPLMLTKYYFKGDLVSVSGGS